MKARKWKRDLEEVCGAQKRRSWGGPSTASTSHWLGLTRGRVRGRWPAPATEKVIKKYNRICSFLLIWAWRQFGEISGNVTRPIPTSQGHLTTLFSLVGGEVLRAARTLGAKRCRRREGGTSSSGSACSEVTRKSVLMPSIPGLSIFCVARLPAVPP